MKSSAFPGPATKILKLGICRTILGIAARRTARPFRGSSNLPINPRVLGSAHSDRTPIPSNLLVSIPFGITTASVSNRSFKVSLAISLTAIFAVILSINGSSMVPIALATFCGFAAAWKVATIGPSPAQPASNESEGIAGSCRWSKSKFPFEIHCLTLEEASGPKITFAIAPL